VGFLIDTSVLIAAERERFSLADLMASLGEEPQALAAITASELLHGVHRAKDPAARERRLRFVEFMLDLFPIIPFDLDAARVHAALWARLQEQGQIIGAHDLLIAATAQMLDYGVITLNQNEFQQIPDLTILNPLQMTAER
jgi:tRNA(fMet)-specific endonuclease VapC